MDRSPSESSLEKIERTDVIEIANHNAIVMQTKENAEVEKEEAVREAVEKVEREWQAKMEAELGALKTKYEVEKQVSGANDLFFYVQTKYETEETVRCSSRFQTQDSYKKS